MKTTLLFIIASVAVAMAHPGGLDKKGGHKDKKSGQYHQHKKPAPPSSDDAAKKTDGDN